MRKIFAKIIFYVRFKVFLNFISHFVTFYWQVMGVKIGKGTLLSKCKITWPNKIKLGKNCIIEHNVFFKHDGIYSDGRSIIIGDNTFLGNNCEFNIKNNINIGNNCLIASGCKFIDHNHGKETNRLMRLQKCDESPIIINDNVWLGVNVVVLKGVSIGSGAIIAANTLVNKSIPENEIWAGTPARKIGERV